MLGFIKDKAQQAKALVGEAVEASASAIVSSDSPSVLVLEGEKQGEPSAVVCRFRKTTTIPVLNGTEPCEYFASIK